MQLLPSLVVLAFAASTIAGPAFAHGSGKSAITRRQVDCGASAIQKAISCAFDSGGADGGFDASCIDGLSQDALVSILFSTA